MQLPSVAERRSVPLYLVDVNIANLFQPAAVVGIVAAGMTFVILTANIDLSMGSWSPSGA